MFCTKCGRNQPEGTRFCVSCGAALDAAQPQQPVAQPVYQQPVYQQPVYQQPVYQQPVYQQPVYQQPVYQQPVYQQPVYQQPVYQQPVYQPAPQPVVRPMPQPVHYSQAKTVLETDMPSQSALKKLLRSPLMMTVMSLLFLVVFAIGIVLLESVGPWFGYYRTNVVIYVYAFFWLLLLMLPVSVAVCTACALKPKGCSRAGVIMLRVVCDIFLGLFGLLLGIFMMEIVIMIQEFSDGYDPVSVWTNAFIALGICTLIVIGIVVFLIRVDGLLSAMSAILKTGKTHRRASVYAAVFSFLMAALLIIPAGIFALEMLTVPNMYRTSYELLLYAAVILTGVVFLLLGILILQYRSRVQPLARIVPAPQPAPQPAAPVVAAPVAETPVAEEPVIAEEPAAEEPAVQEIVAQEPAVEELVIEEATVEEPVAEEPAVEEPTVSEPEFAECEACGKKILAIAKFCPYCGNAR